MALASSDSFACLLRLTRAALRECYSTNDFKNAQILMKVSGMYVTSQSNDVSNVSNVSKVSLLDILLQPDVTIKRLDIKNVSKPSKNTNEDDLAKYHLLKAASLGDADIEVWQCCMFWEYIFVSIS